MIKVMPVLDLHHSYAADVYFTLMHLLFYLYLIDLMKTDAEIQKDVVDELLWEPLLKSSQIRVFVKNGVVTLSGTVNTYAKKAAAEKAVKLVLGMQVHAKSLEVKISPGTKKSNAEIAEVVLKAMKWPRSG
jgi:hypothetical protein